ncbi:dnaj homolog subfamily b member 13-like [Stylonychia lemnae]|uniref:Dnaj homolog subfamily b member 13-like n=1 Tax=Stylonychia lemnae TaxID=5949 RepID=A0A078AJ43_STYLE|nr:dnaj homolog subfamily b member 13-like [Stylonychia lemnae]|eukprot:CDW80823.1 dnaj homolog subfamily b member 13-like [Stylonychia lemnae]
MNKDYYSVLGVSPQASDPEIAQKFRVLALTYHPEKNKSNMAQANYIFTQVCEAYEVLSNPQLREVYDRYGEHLLKNGVPEAKLGFKGGYKFSGNTLEIFEKFFGTSNPFTIALDDNGNTLSLVEQFQQKYQRLFFKKFQELRVNVECTLEEFFFGCKKEILFERIQLMADERSEKVQVISREIEIKPGMGPWTELRFPKEGHQRFANEQSDLIIQLIEEKHPHFERSQDDIIYNHKITLADSLLSKPIIFTTIDNEMIEIAIDEVICPQTQKVIPEKGMPIFNNDPLGPLRKSYQRGNLIVRFDIEFPRQLTFSQKQELTDILNEEE